MSYSNSTSNRPFEGGSLHMVLETDRLTLREFQTADWPAVLAYQNDPQYLRFYEWTTRSAKDVQDFVQLFIDNQSERPRTKFQLAMTLKPGGELIGNCGIRVNAPERGEANIGYELAPEQWGAGFATEAAGEILRFGFQDLGMRRIWATTVAANQASARVLQKLNMRLVQGQPERVLIKGTWQETLFYEILSSDWSPAASISSENGGSRP